MSYELDDLDRALIEKVRDALGELDENGSPIKDYLDEDDMIDGMRLLSQVVGKTISRKGRPKCAP